MIGISSPMAMAATSPTSSSSTSATGLATSAAKTESAAYLQYYGYAAAADKTGQTAVANVWRTVGQVEHQDHWTHDTSLAGLYSSTDNVTNLQTAITQANQAAAADTNWAAQAPQGSAAAAEVRAVAVRETADAGLLTQALAAVQGKGSVPDAPTVTTVPIEVSATPHYSGTFYNDLTNGSNSALETAAWNWAQYQFDAKTAVDTGQAKLAALLSGLAAQEQYQNWAGLSNAAGYVNGTAENLQASISSEQDAIDMYGEYATQAQQAGDATVASTFRSIMGDENGHHQTFSTELPQLNSGH